MTWARYEPLPRPERPRDLKAPPPTPLAGTPPAPAWLVGDPVILRVAQRLNITVAELDERLTVWDLLAESDALHYLRDVDDRPVATGKELVRILAERAARA